jgi:two-component system, cell cycle sensor histidine kinase and response regulator CckA
MSAGRHVLLSVSDTGEGMDEETRARIFDPFFTTKVQGKGTGLGLSTVYGIVKQSGGSIWVYSELGLGTTFKLYFPVADAGGESAGSHAFSSTRRGSERILVVEDEDAIRHLVRRLLRNAGYEVLEAASGAEALERLRDPRTDPVHMVLTDLVMPGMSGTQLAVELGRTHPDVKILLATGYSIEAVSGRLPTDRGWNLIGKPYSIEHLLREVRRILDE